MAVDHAVATGAVSEEDQARAATPGDRRVRVDLPHQRFTQVTLMDSTDHYNELVQSRE